MNKIKISLCVGFNLTHEKQTDAGIVFGEEVVKVVELPIKEAQKQLQTFLGRMDYEQAQEYVRKWG